MKQVSTRLSVQELAAVSGGKKTSLKKSFRCTLGIVGGTITGATAGPLGALAGGIGAVLSVC